MGLKGFLWENTTQTQKVQLKNWHKDTPNPPVMPYNTLISNQPMKDEELLKLASYYLTLHPIDENEPENLLKFARALYEEGYDDGYSRGYVDGEDIGYDRGTLDGEER